LTTLTYDDIQKLQGSEARKAAEQNIVVNDLPAAWEILSNARKTRKNEERRVDIILDNAGFELFVDLILAGYLLSAGLATTIVLHPKSIPWFVSDVLPNDFIDLISALANPQEFFTTPDDKDDLKSNRQPPTPLSEKEVKELKFLFEQWSAFHGDGKLIIRPNRFWTAGGSYWRLPHEAPELLDDLKSSELVIFKGDLNYRKLTGDVRFLLTLEHGAPEFAMRRYSFTSSFRRTGIQPLLSPPPLVPSVLVPAYGFSRCAPARRMWLWVSQQAKMRDCEDCLVEVETLEHASGHGVESGPSYHSAMGRREAELVCDEEPGELKNC
jgi:hypothetical protein